MVIINTSSPLIISISLATLNVADNAGAKSSDSCNLGSSSHNKNDLYSLKKRIGRFIEFKYLK